MPDYHLVFTLPAVLGAVACQNKAVVYDLLFKASAETLATIAANLERIRSFLAKEAEEAGASRERAQAAEERRVEVALRCRCCGGPMTITIPLPVGHYPGLGPPIPSGSTAHEHRPRSPAPVSRRRQCRFRHRAHLRPAISGLVSISVEAAKRRHTHADLRPDGACQSPSVRPASAARSASPVPAPALSSRLNANFSSPITTTAGSPVPQADDIAVPDLAFDGVAELLEEALD